MAAVTVVSKVRGKGCSKVKEGTKLVVPRALEALGQHGQLLATTRSRHFWAFLWVFGPSLKMIRWFQIYNKRIRWMSLD